MYFTIYSSKIDKYCILKRYKYKKYVKKIGSKKVIYKKNVCKKGIYEKDVQKYAIHTINTVNIYHWRLTQKNIHTKKKLLEYFIYI